MNIPIGSSDGEREAFETFIKSKLNTYPLGAAKSELHGEYYASMAVQDAWLGWQARAALSSDREMAPEAKADLVHPAGAPYAYDVPIENGNGRTLVYAAWYDKYKREPLPESAIALYLGASSAHIAQRSGDEN